MARTPISLLLVEDDQIDRLACRRALANHPDYEFEFIEAESGCEGVRLAALHQPDLVLLDYHLPDLDGLEFLAALERETGETSIPVMMLTGADNVGVAVEAMRGGARDYLVKDRERSYLALLPTVIERVLREQRLRRDKRDAETKFRTLVEQIPAITYMATPDASGRLLYVSPQAQSLGHTAEEWLALPHGLFAVIHPDDRAAVQAAYAACGATGEPLRCEYRVVTRAGALRWLLDEGRMIRGADGVPQFLQGVLIDITEDKRREAELQAHRLHLQTMVAERTAQLERQTGLLAETNASLVKEIDERRLAEQALRRSEAHFRLLLESAGEGIYGLDTEGRCIFVNDAALEMLGYGREELLGQPTHERIHHSREDGSAYAEDECPIYDAFRVGVARRGMVEPLWRKDGSMLIAEYSSYPLREDDAVSGAVLVFRDVTESHALASQLAWQATHDALTGLINRQEFERRLAQAIDGVRRDGGVHALCYLDLDRFKLVNDTAGHAAGDELLRQVSRLLEGHMRQRDSLARLGGDEFGVLLEHCPADRALRLAVGMRDAVRDYRFSWQGRSFTVGVSIGVVAVDADTESAAAAMSAADAACYVAKEQGRNRAHLYQADEVNATEQRSQMRWVSRLSQALDENRFRLYCQAIVPLHAGAATRPHYEVLLRLQEAEGPLIEPMAFMPVAERYSLMPAIDRWVLAEVVRACAVTQNEAAPLFAVNLSGRSLADDRLAGYLAELLQAHGVSGDRLCLEIAEASTAENLSRSSQRISEFKMLGCRIALDCYGSGMSAFADLRMLPVDFIKIDGGFIRSLAEDRLNHAVTEAINRVAHVMSIETVAGCTETASIVTALKKLGIDHAQGYVLGMPQPIETLIAAPSVA